jgi:integrase
MARKRAERAGTITELPSGGYRVRWYAITATGERTRRGETFASRAEAEAHLGGLRRDGRENPLTGTIGAKLEEALEIGTISRRLHRSIDFLREECGDLLSTPLDDEERLELALGRITARRAKARSLTARQTKRGEEAPRLAVLAEGIEVRKVSTGWEMRRSGGAWEAILFRTHKERAAQRLAMALPLIVAGRTRVANLLKDSDESYGFHRTLVARGIVAELARSPLAKVQRRETARKTRLELYHLLRKILKKHADLVPEPLKRSRYEDASQGKAYIETRKRTALGLHPDLPYLPEEPLESILLAARRVGSREGASDAERALALIAATGLRSGEALGLRWFDFSGEILHLRGTKTKAARREVFLEPRIMGAVSAGIVAELALWRGDAPDDALCFSREGKPLRSTDLRAALAKVATEGKAPKPSSRCGLWVHGFRHYFAQLARNRGAGSELSAHLGHSSISFTDQTYAVPSGRLFR